MYTQYLDALGLDLWVPRAAPPQAARAAAIAPSPVGAIAAVEHDRAISPKGAGDAERSADVETLWHSIADEVRGCVRCGLCRSRTQTVFGVGNRRAELLVVGEAPGADEDAQGEPFVGRAGQLLNSILRAMHWPRETVYIANILKCRPPGNRDPLPEEVRQCLPYLHRQIELLQPLMMLAVGRIAAQNLLDSDTQIGKLRGHVHHFGPSRIPLIVTYHPAYLMRSPAEKRKSWTDLKLLRAELDRRRALLQNGSH